jgi:ABC-2 type transport system ATP-binding protein
MVRLTHLRKSFGPTLAVDDLSLEIGKGEVFGLLGPNGAGKSTTISMAVGLLTPDSGSVEFEGHGPPRDPHVRRQLGIAPQALALYDDLSGDENLAFFGKMYGLASADLNGVSKVLDLVGLAPKRADRTATYSGGMKRRLNLAAALIHDPPILLLDEPTAGVDPQSRNNILDLVRQLASEGRTIVYTTHYMEEAAKLCSRVGIMDKGKLLALGTVPELITRHGGKSVVTIETEAGAQRYETEDPVREISNVMQNGGVGVVGGIRIDRPDLESVFLALTGRSLRD